MLGIYIGLSSSGFWDYDNILWFNLTDTIYSQIGEGNSSNCTFFTYPMYVSTWSILMKCLCFAGELTFSFLFNPCYDFFP